MIETFVIAGWLLAFYHGVRAGGPLAALRMLRDPDVAPAWKLALLACVIVPVPGPLDNLAAAAIVRRCANR